MRDETSLQLPTTEMLRMAVQARSRAYAPYSNFRVGAALLDHAGMIHTGCNVENSSYGLTQCAERTAVCSAVAQGVKQFKSLVIVSQGAVPPCGACRQVLSEFAAEDLLIWLVDESTPQSVVTTSLYQLLPMRFRLDEMK